MTSKDTWIENLQAENAALRTEQERLKEESGHMRAALEALDSAGGLGYAKHAMIRAALTLTPRQSKENTND